MNPTLQTDLQSLDTILQTTQEYALSFLNEIDNIAPGKPFSERLPAAIPEKGEGFTTALQEFHHTYRDGITAAAGPRYFGFVTGGATPAALAGDWLTSAFDQNSTNSSQSAAAQVEIETIHMLRQLFGLPESFFGTFVSGATMSNFVGLALGRQWVGKQLGINVAQEGVATLPQLKVLSAAIHASAVKSLAMLGLGRNSLISVPTLPDREAIDLKKLEEALQSLQGTPCIVVANAGTVNTVDFDDIAAIVQLRKRYPFWLHVDAAFGGFAGCTPTYSHLLNGWQEADSITIDAHKWLNVPYDSAMIFTRHKSLQLEVFQNANARYLGDPEADFNYINYTPENSRRFRALPAWFSLKAYGRDGYRDIVETTISLAQQLGDFIEESEAFTLLAPVRICVVCFTINTPHTENLQKLVNQFLEKLVQHEKVVLTPTVYKGVPAMRAALVNWRTTQKDLEITKSELMQVVSQLLFTSIPA
ncbi:pyridoxal-dependent decarboxylase [Cytophagaceae bacterium YF14B1]|uniref:Pyridoxal-dependent decarboxylase n=1 Tax=Xanthocytophaga flava TaxID=3048013 RepID=A0AAE3UAT9_9BACT|nr:pyridoxal-dependent decarboxylase [Xanthocytophaga flavus]MDJ1485072.1 pyridoxal-dependent decarboxylase [Xanthocytophaga flavus]